MSDITVINDSEQSSLVTNGLAKNGELYLKAAGSTDAGAVIVYDSGAWRTFANEYAPAGLANAYSVSFDGTNDFIQTDYNPSSGSTFSGSVWVKTSDTSSSMAFFSMETGSAVYGITLKSPGSSKNWWVVGPTFASNGGIGGTGGASSIRDGNWHHIVLTVNSQTLKIYTDGSLVGTTTVANGYSGPTSSTRKYIIGRGYAVGAYQFNGLMDEVAFFESELSSSDVSSIYNSGTPADLTSYSPVGWYRMGDDDSGTGTTITDQGSGGNDGTFINGPTFSSDVPS